MKFPFFKRKEPDPEWYATAPPEGVERKERSEAILRKQRVPILRQLPMVETSDTAQLKPKEAIVGRIDALTLVAVKGEGPLGHDEMEQLCAKHRGWEFFSTNESVFMRDRNPAPQTSCQFSWRYEALWTLLWSASLVPELNQLDTLCDVPLAVSFLRDKKPDGLLRDATIRPIGQLLDQADLIYRYHWAVRNAQITGQPIPPGINPGIVMERHHALNWLVGEESDWDAVQIHT